MKGTLCAAVASALLGGCAQEPAYLFVQSARSAVLEDGVLTLEEVSPTTLYFTDRPVRMAGHFQTDRFMELMDA